MAVIGSATVTLTQYRDIQSVTRYYKLQIVGSSAPLKPETKPPSSDWTDSEPACDISKELYFCDLTIFSNGEGEYSKVSKSTSYEAAKEAYNKAQSAKDSIDNLEIGGRNLLIGSEKGVVSTYADTSSYADIKLQAHNGSTYVGQEFSFGVTAGEHIEYTYTSKYSGDRVRIGDNGSAHDAVNTFLVPEYKEGVVYTFSCDVIDDRPNVVGGYVLKNLKLEKGNKATDWTLAPEDVDAGIANAAEVATNYITDISDSNGVQIKSSLDSNNKVQIKSDGMHVYQNINNTSTEVALFGNTARIGKQNDTRFEVNSDNLSAYSGTNKYFKVSPTGIGFGDNQQVLEFDPETNGLTISIPDSLYKIKITNEKIEFINTGSIDPIATISGQSLTIPKSTMIDEMQVGDKCWSWRVKDDKSLQLKWIG